MIIDRLALGLVVATSLLAGCGASTTCASGATSAPPPVTTAPVAAAPPVDSCPAERASLAQNDTPQASEELATCEEAAGHLVDALRSSQHGLAVGLQAKKDFAAMQASRAHVQKLLARISHVTFLVDGDPVERLVVSFDGQEVPADKLSRRLSVDAGEHRIRAAGVRNGRSIVQEKVVVVNEAEAIEIPIRL